MTMAWPPYNLVATTEGVGKIVLSWHNNMAYIPVYVNANDRICFKENVNELVTQIPAALDYTAETMAAAIAAAMTTASESVWTYYADFSSESNLWTISCGNVFSILWNTGTYIINDLSDFLGFADDHDDTGSASYAGENAAQYTNPHYDIVYIERSLTTGSGFAQIGSVMWGSESYEDTSVEDGTHYYYRIRGYWNGVYTDYSSEDDAWTILPAPGSFYGTCIDKNTVKILWEDLSTNETGFKIYCNGNESYDTVGQNIEEYTDGGLTAATWYYYKVRAYNASTESSWTQEIGIFTTDPPNAPSSLTGQATATTKVRLNFQDNSSNETAFAIMENSGGGWSEIDTVGANVTTYERTGLTPNTSYSYLVKARGAGGDSGYSNQVDVTTWADIAKPTNVVATAISDTIIEVTFQDNSAAEDHHVIYYKADGGAYDGGTEIAPNVTYYKKTGLTKGVLYWFKIRAKEDTGPAYSDYSSEASATTISEPAAPTVLAISEIQDTWMVLTWTYMWNATGHKIEKSTDGVNYTEIVVATAWHLQRFKVTGLLPSTQYWFRIRAYNAAGNSAYSGVVNDTTLAAYDETAFETLCRNPIPKFKFLVEFNPIMELAGFALSGGQTYTYELEVLERGIDIETVTENDATYTEKTSIATVEATASTFWFDYYGRKLYVHTSGGNDPVNYQVLGTFYLRFTNFSTAEVPTVYNENMYLSFIPAGGIPDTGGEIKPYYEGNYAVSSGTVSIINPALPTAYYWDQKFAKYEFRNRDCAIKLGGENFTYAQFQAIHTGSIHGVEFSDGRALFTLRDKRAGLARTLPLNLYDSTVYPLIDLLATEVRIPFFFGTQANIVPTCIDTTNKKYKFHDGRTKAVNSCTKNGLTALVEDTDFYVDYQNSILQLADGVTLGDGEFLVLNIDGQPDSSNALISNGADIFRYICNNFLGLSDAELNLDSIYETKLGFTTAIAVPIYQTESSDDIFRKLEHTMRAYTFQDEQGRIGLKMAATTAPSNVRYVRNHHIFSHKQRKSLDDAYYEVTVYYNVNPKTQHHQWKKIYVETMRRKTGSLQPLPIYTYLPTEATAQTLLNNIIAEIDKSFVEADTGPVILGVLPGDIIKYTRDRFYSLDGTANALNLRILKIGKSFTGTAARVSITAEVVS